MKKRRLLFQKTVSLITGFLLVFQSLTPGFFIASQVAAQDATVTETPTPTPVITPEPTQIVEPTQTPTPAIEPTQEITPTPTEEVTPTIEPTTPTPENTPSDPPKETGPPADDKKGEILDGVSTESPTPVPTITPIQPETGEIQATILKNIAAPTLDLDGVNPDGSAQLSTDKADYAPTDTAIITGTDFTPGRTFQLIISSQDEPATSITADVTADEKGNFIYAYQLDGNYRPNYSVTIKSGETVVASTTFTDTSYSVESYSDNTYLTVKNDFLPGETVYGKGAILGGSSANIRLVFKNPSNIVVKTCSSINSTITTCEYSLPSDAPYGKWGIEIQKDEVKKDTDHFNVTLNWPTSWTTPNSCVTDPTGEPGVSPDEVDLTGNSSNPAVGFYSDSNYQYFRERVDGNPGSSNDLHEYSWVVLFQTTSPKYQYLASVTGKNTTELGGKNKVSLWLNDPATASIDFNPLFGDTADSVLWSGASNIYSRVVNAGSGIYYIDWAIPLTELTSRGISSSTTKFFATSSNANNYNKDHLKCYETMSDISIIKSDNPDPVTSGGTLTYTLSIHNAGPDTASGVVVSDTLPVGYSVTSVTPSQGTCSDITGSSIQCELGSMVNGADATMTIVGTMTGSGTVTNTASVTLDTTVSIDTNQSNNNDSEDTTINPAAVCGDGLVNQTSEQCDDGAQNGFACTPAYGIGGQPDSCNYCSDTCQTVTVTDGYCGDSLINGPEECDGTNGVSEHYQCTDLCLLEYIPYCGDNTIDTNNGEQCDDGNTSDGDGCNATCQQEGKIIIEKQTLPDGSPQTFAFTPNYGTGFTLMDGQTNMSSWLASGTYSVSETVPTGWDLTSISCNDANSGTSAFAGNTATIIIDSGETVTCTFTNTQRGAISGHKYNDLNGNGGHDSDEPGLPEWTIFIDGNDNQAIDSGETSTPTDSSGVYTFANLVPGDYSVCEVQQTDWTKTAPASCHTVTVIAGQDSANYNFFNFQCATIGGLKWEDSNGDRVKDTGEPIKSGWTINLDGPEDSSTTTNADGNYSFKVCKAGNYTLTETFPNSDWYQTSPGGASPNHQVDVTSGGEYTGNDFGNARYAKISGFKYRDNDGDGVLDADDLGDTLAGWTFDLYDGATNLIIDTFETITGGYYEFTGLLVNKTYYVLEQLLPGWTQTYGPTPTPTPFAVQSGENKQVDFANFELGKITVCKYNDLTGNGQYDSADDQPLTNIDITLSQATNPIDTKSTGENGCVTFDGLSAGTYRVEEDYTDPDLDGYYSTNGITHHDVNVSSGTDETKIFLNALYRTISGTKYNDLNGNGSRDPDELGLENWTIFIDYNNNGILEGGEPSTITDADGNYEFSNLTADSYTIAEDLMPGWGQTQPTAGHYDIDVHTQVTSTRNDFGNQMRGSITIRKDAVPDRAQNFRFISSQLGNFLLDDDNNPTLSNEKVFTDLGSNSYTITEAEVSDWRLTNLSCDGDDNAQIDQNNRTVTINLDQPGENIICTFENTQNGSIQGRKYEDVNGDGNWDSGESYLNNWRIHLFDTAWNQLGEMTTGDTGITGQYKFTNLEPNTYYVCEDMETSWAQTQPNSGETRNDTYCHEVTVNAGQNVSGKHFGNFKLGVIQSRKYEDLNNDSTIDTGEPYLDGWTIRLYKQGDGWQLADSKVTGHTGTLGQYRFENLNKGTYYLCEVLQSGWAQSDPDSSEGFANLSGQNDEASRCRRVIINQSGQESIGERHFGNFELGKVQGKKFEDVDGDEAPHESGEAFLNGWTMRLYNNWEEPIEVTTTNTDVLGQYRFSNLLPGTYQVCEVLHPGWTQTWPRVGDVPIADNGTAHSEYGTAITNLSLATDEAPVCWQTVIDHSGEFNYLLRFGNTQYGTVNVTKFDDEDGDGEKDENEPYLSGWEMTLSDYGVSTTSADGVAQFSNVLAGNYVVGENMQPLWKQTHISCTTAQPTPTPTPNQELTLLPIEKVNAVDTRPDNEITVNPGETVNCLIGNHYSPPTFEISKENDTAGLDRSPGSSILYTLTLKVKGNNVFHVNLIDLLPQGFVYRPGSRSATRNGAFYDVDEPTYASPGTWNLKDLHEDYEVALTFIADVSGDQKPGLYKDLALAYGCQTEEKCAIGGTNSVIATAIAPGDIGETHHVGTNITIVKDQQDAKTLNVERTETGSVLGASTELPATGANANWIIIAISFMITGLGAIVISSKMRRYHA
ncbi:MAG: SdrD B-like domain-containing protein [Candidatus Gottesmanbacteria bacterium]